MKQEEWEKEIADALKSASDAIPDRAGETPVLRLSRRLKGLDPTAPESVAAGRAVVGAVRSTEANDARRWIDLCRIARFSKLADTEIRRALLDRFLQGVPEDPEARTQVMTTLTDLGYRFAPEELQRESAIEQAYPAAWVSTWIRCGHFDLIKGTISKLVRAGALDVTSVLRLLPAWYQILGGRLVTAVPDWFGASALEERTKVRRWFELRGHPLPQSFCVDPRPDGKLPIPVFGDDDCKFVHEAGIGRAYPIADSSEARPHVG
ncbi:MAG: hypothetical protein ACT4QB_06430 [Gammaproteobacteria bacterium]